jgi:hypothetical protein
MKNNNIFIIFLLQLFYKICSYQVTFYYFSKDATSIKQIKINNDDIENIYSNKYEGNLIPGSTITISLDKNEIDDLTCVNILGYINYTDSNNNPNWRCIKFKLENLGDETYNKNFPLNGINCGLSCFNIDGKEGFGTILTLTGYFPFKCGKEKKISVIIGNETDIVSYLKEILENINDFIYYIDSILGNEKGLLKINNQPISRSTHYNISNGISFLGIKYGQYIFFFHAYKSSDFWYTTTNYGCKMTINICWVAKLVKEFKIQKIINNIVMNVSKDILLI